VQVGFIGLGNMGNRLAPRLLQAGHDLVVTDLVPEAGRALRDQGAAWADSACDVAAASEVTFASVSGPVEVDRLVLDPDRGIIEALRPGSVFVDLTTSAPETSRKLASAIAERGAAMLDSPVSSGGGTTLVVGGERDVFERVLPLLNALASHVYYMGPTGSGNYAKLARQYAGFTAFWAEVEALLMAKKAGLDARAVAEFLEITGAGRGLPGWLNRLFEGDFGTPETAGARLDIVAKDVGLAMDAARRLGTSARTGLGADDIMRRAQAQGWGRHDFFVAVQVIEALAGARLDEPAGVPLG
jgi:3-hydroxyisobutyrate dehydrogenase-like beta-hydroxyacid dehydrogenase